MAYPTANLCSLCKSIPFHDLPPFPDSSYMRTLSGNKYLHRLIHRAAANEPAPDPIPDPLGFRHHPDLESLRASSAAGCDICREIKRLGDGVLADIEEDKKWYAEHPRVQMNVCDPSFELWITKRGEGGDGFWVTTKSISEPARALFVIATFGYCVENGEAFLFPSQFLQGWLTNVTL
jgi:hypothetical protein